MRGLFARAKKKLTTWVVPEEQSPLAHFESRERDVFIVSYPRSGNTWVRFLLANLICFEDGTPVDFNYVHPVIPDVVRETRPEVLQALPDPRLLKSHSTYDPRFRRVIYVVRDGRDVVVSYYHFLTGKGRFEGSFLDFLNAQDLKAGLWQEHVTSWLLNADQASFLLVRYEDLHRQAASEVTRMARFIGLPCDQARLDWAIENASFESMRKLESEKGRAFDADSPSQMVRTGTVGGWRDHFEEVHKEAFKRHANRVLLQLGYAESEDW
jgi:estrone sulfotransferase